MISQKKGKTPGQSPSLQIETDQGQEEILDSHFTRILEANVQSNMLWQSHLKSGKKALLPHVRKLLGQLKHIGKLIPIASRKNLARGLILSRLSYCMPLWGSASNTYLRKTQTLKHKDKQTNKLWKV